MVITRILRMPPVKKYSREACAYIETTPATDVEVTLDFDLVGLTRRMGGTAWANSTKKAQQMKGLIKATAKAATP